jgi:hypothetical protein
MRVWVNEARTVAIHMFDDGTVRVLLRESPDDIWRPPVRVVEEK